MVIYVTYDIAFKTHKHWFDGKYVFLKGGSKEKPRYIKSNQTKL